MHESKKDKVTRLSVNQEELLVEKPILILLCICVSTEMTVDVIARMYQLNLNELRQHLSTFDRLGIIVFAQMIVVVCAYQVNSSGFQMVQFTNLRCV